MYDAYPLWYTLEGLIHQYSLRKASTRQVIAIRNKKKKLVRDTAGVQLGPFSFVLGIAEHSTMLDG